MSLGHVLLPYKGAGLEMEYPRQEPVLLRDASATGEGLACYAMALGLEIHFAVYARKGF